jgi:hypothetical protein
MLNIIVWWGAYALSVSQKNFPMAYKPNTSRRRSRRVWGDPFRFTVLPETIVAQTIVLCRAYRLSRRRAICRPEYAVSKVLY